MSDQTDQPSTIAKPTEPSKSQGMAGRLQTGLVTTLLGLFVFTVGAKPNYFGWDRSPVVGFVQIAVFLIGLGIICLGGFVGILGLWRGRARSIVADMGVRVVGTGYVIAFFSGMADTFGMGSQPPPGVPYFGPWQATGVVIGEIIVAVGFLMMVPYRAPHLSSERAA